MKFSLAWSQIADQNIILKTALVSLSLCTICFALLSLKLALKEPLVIERSCYSKIANLADSKRTDDEVETFLKLALEQRFNTSVKSLKSYVSPNELALRLQEQKELSGRQLSQTVLVNSLKLNGSDVEVDATRVITVGTVRSALPFLLTVKIERQERDENNPYGLLLAQVKQVEKKE